MKKNLVNILIPIVFSAGAALAADGDLDPTFGVQGKRTISFDLGGDLRDDARAVALAPNGKIYLVGTVDGPNGDSGVGIARLDSNGAPDLAFGGQNTGKVFHTEPAYDGGVVVAAAAIQPDGKIVVAGSADVDPGQLVDRDFIACRFNADGSIDQGFGNQATPGCRAVGINLDPSPNTDFATSLVIQSDGKIVLAGAATVQQLFRGILVRLTVQGALDTDTFGESGIAQVPPEFSASTFYAVTQASDGKLIAVGDIFVLPGNNDFLTIPFNLDGTLAIPGVLQFGFDAGLGFNNDRAKAVHVYPDGTVLVAGDVQIGANSYQMGAVKYSSINGTFDTSFGTNGFIHHIFCDVCTNALVGDMYVQTDGRIVLAGPVSGDPQFFRPDFGVMRLDINGERDTTFSAQGIAYVEFDQVGGNADDVATSVISQGGRILVAGTVAAPGGPFNTDFGIARLDNDLIFADDFEGDGN